MTPQVDRLTVEGRVTMRYWASARAAAGVDSEDLDVSGAVPLSELISRVCQAHAHSARFAEVIACCAVMVGERPVTTSDPSTVLVDPGVTVEFLPPFAGG